MALKHLVTDKVIDNSIRGVSGALKVVTWLYGFYLWLWAADMAADYLVRLFVGGA